MSRGSILQISLPGEIGLLRFSERGLEYAAVEDLYSPAIHRLNQVVRHRAVFPDEAIPPVPEVLTKYAMPPQELVEQARSKLDALSEAAAVKKGKANEPDRDDSKSLTRP